MANTANCENLGMTQSSVASHSINSTNGGGTDSEQQQGVGVNGNTIDAMESKIGFDYKNSTDSQMSNSFKQFRITTSRIDEYSFVSNIFCRLDLEIDRIDPIIAEDTWSAMMKFYDTYVKQKEAQLSQMEETKIRMKMK